MNNNFLGKVIKSLRDEKGISQAKLAKEINVSQKSIDFWEKGLYEPKARNISDLAKFFNITTDELIGAEDNTTIKTPKQYSEKAILYSQKLGLTPEQFMNPPKELFNSLPKQDELFKILEEKGLFNKMEKMSDEDKSKYIDSIILMAEIFNKKK